MFGDKYKRDNEKIKPRPEVIKSLSEKMKYNIEPRKVIYVRVKKSFKYALVAVSFVFIFTLFNMNELSGNNKFAKFYKDMKNSENENKSKYKKEDKNQSENELGVIGNETGLYIPNITIEKPDENIEASMIRLIVYNGRVYTESSTKVSNEDGKLLMGEKIGITRELFSEIDSLEIESGAQLDLEKLEGLVGVGGLEIYEAKGYDKSFRLITYVKDELGERTEFYECLNGIRINTGKDIFEKMNILNNIKSVEYDTFNNWNNGTLDSKNIDIDENVNNFIEAMYESIPYSLEDKEFRNQFHYDEIKYYAEVQDKQRKLYLKLKDSTSIEITLFSNGYMSYPSLHGYVFKIEEKAFNDLWEKLLIPGV